MLALVSRACAKHLLLHLVYRSLRLLEELDLLLQRLFLLSQVVILHL